MPPALFTCSTSASRVLRSGPPRNAAGPVTLSTAPIFTGSAARLGAPHPSPPATSTTAITAASTACLALMVALPLRISGCGRLDLGLQRLRELFRHLFRLRRDRLVAERAQHAAHHEIGGQRDG